MTRDFLSSTAPDRDRFTGMTLADVLLLPEDVQPLATWLIRQTEPVSVEAVAAHLNVPAATAQDLLTELRTQGFVQTVEVNGETHYQTRLDRRRASQMPDVIWQTLAPGSPLAVIQTVSPDQAIMAGESFDLYITIDNQGNQSALIDVFIDETGPPYSWCTAPRDRLALGPGPQSKNDPLQNGEVIFHFQVPPETPPGTYDYWLVVDAPEHYPEETPMRYQHSVQVLPPVQQQVMVQDPTFALSPVTTADQPAVLAPGGSLEVQVRVQNTSERVDRFRVACPDLDATWVTVRYPEGLEMPGMVQFTEGLNLNPGEAGQILLLIHPPPDAIAGIYSPTIRLHSLNNPDLALLDLVYFQIQPLYLLNLELRTLRGTVRTGAGTYDVRLLNDGNTERDLTLRAYSAEEDGLCDYRLTPTQFLLPPKSRTNAELTVQPRRWWRRPWFGGGRLINFFVEVQDEKGDPLLNDRWQGVLIWQARPWWQLLLLILLILGLTGAIATLVWLALTRTPPNPQIIEFKAENETYQEGGEAIRVGWQIRNPEQLQELHLLNQGENGNATGDPIIFDFSRAPAGTVPKELRPFCGEKLQPVLTCRGVPTDARRVGSYVFELQVIPRNGNNRPSDQKKTGAIAIAPKPPVIASLKIDNREVGSKFLIPINPQNPVQRLTLSWQVQGGKGLQVELLPTPGTVPPQGAVPYIVTQKPSSQTFTLKATNPAGQSISRAVTIEVFDPSAPQPAPGTLPGPLPSLPMPGGSSPPGGPTAPPLPPGGTTPPPPGGTAPGTPGAPGDTGTPPPQRDPNAPTPTDPGRVSPSELPPQFD